MQLLASARFRETVVDPRRLDAVNPASLPEIAFVGRSNAGKSTCINLLCGRRRLAFSSRTPGRTQALNLFAVGPEDGELGFLVDTPGYGYAAAPQASKGAWQALAGDYLRNRASLTAVVVILDVRRELTTLDRQLLSWAPERLPIAAVLTKSDKLGRMQVAEACRRVAADPALAGRVAPVEVIPFSALSRIGVESLQRWIEQHLPSAVGVPPGVDDAATTDAAALSVRRGDVAAPTARVAIGRPSPSRGARPQSPLQPVRGRR